MPPTEPKDAERQERGELLLIDGLVPMSQRERLMGIALTEAKHLLMETREYIFDWRGPSEAALSDRIKAHIPKIQTALATELGTPARANPKDPAHED